MKKIINFLIIILTIIYFYPLIVFAQESNSLAEVINNPANKMMSKSGLTNFTLGYIISIIIQAALSLLGIIFLIIIVFSGYRWMTASGNEEAIKKSQGAIKQAIIGLIIILMAYAITYFIFGQLSFLGIGGNSGSGGVGSSGV